MGPEHEPLLCRGEVTPTTLRSLILGTGYLSWEVNWYCGLATAIMQSLWKPLSRQNNINYQTELHIYNVSMLSVLNVWFWNLAPQPVTHQKNTWFASKSLRTIKWICWQDHVTNPVSLWADTAATSQCLHGKMQATLVWTSAVPSIWSLDSGIYHFDPSAACWRRPQGVHPLAGPMVFSVTLNDLVWIPMK